LELRVRVRNWITRNVQENLFKFDLTPPNFDSEASQRELTLICVIIVGLEDPTPLTIQNVYERIITWFPAYRRIEKEPVARFSPELWKLHWKLYYTLTHWACSTDSASWAHREPNERWDGLPLELIGPRYTVSPSVFSRAAISFLQSKRALPAQQISFHKFMNLPVEIREMVLRYAFDVVHAPLRYADLDATTGWPHHGYREIFTIDSDIRKPDRRYIGAADLESLLATSMLSHSLFRSMLEIARLHLVFGEMSDFNRVMASFGSLGRFVRSLTFRADGTYAALRENTDVYPESISHTFREIRVAQWNMQRLRNLQRVTLVHFLTRDTGMEELLRGLRDFVRLDVVLECRCEQ
jgi:hypothetical protein